MATLQDILDNNDPEGLKKLLGKNSSNEDSPESGIDQYKQIEPKKYNPEVVKDPNIKPNIETSKQEPIDAEFSEIPEQMPKINTMEGVPGALGLIGAGLATGSALGKYLPPVMAEEGENGPKHQSLVSEFKKNPNMLEPHNYDVKKALENADKEKHPDFGDRESFTKGTLGEGPFAKGEDYEPTVPGEEPKDEDIPIGPSVTSPHSKEWMAQQLDNLHNGQQNPAEDPRIAAMKAQVAMLRQPASTGSLADAQAQADKNDRLAGILRGLDIATAGAGSLASRTKIAPSGQEMFKDMQKEAQQPVADFLARQENEKKDPNSTYSKAFRTSLAPILAKAGFDPKSIEGLSGESLEKVFPNYTKMFDVEEATKARKETAANTAAIKQQGLDQRSKDNADKQDQKETAASLKAAAAIGDKVNPERASSRTGMGADASTLRRIRSVRSILEGSKTLDDVPPQDMFEVYRTLDTAISGGASTKYSTSHLDPATARAKAADLLQKATNQYQGAQGSHLLNHTLGVMDRLEGDAKDRLLNSAKTSFASNIGYIKAHPEHWIPVLDQVGLGLNDVLNPPERLSKKMAPGFTFEDENGHKRRVTKDGLHAEALAD